MLKNFKNIKTFVFDIDGVLTDGKLLITQEGVMLREMNVRDGYTLQLAIKKGYEIIVISGSFSAEVQIRLERLGITKIFMRIENKLQTLKELIVTFHLNKEEILYMGDDIPDYDAMTFVGLPCCPCDAATEIKQISKYISPLQGGFGCAREVIEKVMKLRGDWRLDTHVKSQ